MRPGLDFPAEGGQAVQRVLIASPDARPEPDSGYAGMGLTPHVTIFIVC
ncbi:MAG: hypothetical protein NT175_05880 [Bacteroidetes bacterium]|nr:hypothetical protein [Bacteroidota bacterium]